MSTPLPFIINNGSITVFVSGSPITVEKEDVNYACIRQAIIDKDWETVAENASKTLLVETFGNGELKVADGAIYYKGEAIHNYVVDRIFEFMAEGIEATPLINFLDKLLGNPSKRCLDELFAFLEYGNMPLDPDGDFYAYKAVRSDWTDKHTGTIQNKIGDIVEVPRNAVDDDSSHACSHGLHAGSLAYVKSFGSGDDIYIIVKINPQDVVSVPSHDTRKLRCRRYEITGLYNGPLPSTLYKDNDDDYDDDDYDAYDDD